jgi:hypothetical protein
LRSDHTAQPLIDALASWCNAETSDRGVSFNA